MSEIENKGMPLTDNHKQKLYIDSFRDMKSQILEITLIDYETGTKLMRDYVELTRKIDSSGELSKDIFSEMETLRKSVEEHKSTELAKKDVAVVTIRGKCDYLMSMLSADTLEEVESSWRELKESVESRKIPCSLEELSQIQNVLTYLHFAIIKEKVKKDPSINMQDEISHEEVSEMTSSMYFQITSLLNSADERQTKIGQDIKNNVLLYVQMKQSDKIPYDKQIWRMFAEADIEKDNGIAVQKNDMPKATNNLPAINTRSGIMQRIMGMFNRKSEIDRITEEVVTDDKIYEAVCKAIQDRVKGEDIRARGIEEYYRSADRRLPVFDFLKSIDIEDGKARESHQFTLLRKGAWDCISITDEPLNKCVTYWVKRGLNESGVRIKCGRHSNLIDLYHFANLLGEATSGTFQFHLDNCGETLPDSDKVYQDEFIADLSKRLKRAMKEYRKQKKSFFMTEEGKIKEATSENKKKAFIEGVAVDITPIVSEQYKGLKQDDNRALHGKDGEQK